VPVFLVYFINLLQLKRIKCGHFLVRHLFWGHLSSDLAILRSVPLYATRWDLQSPERKMQSPAITLHPEGNLAANHPSRAAVIAIACLVRSSLRLPACLPLTRDPGAPTHEKNRLHRPLSTQNSRRCPRANPTPLRPPTAQPRPTTIEGTSLP
jgi:hypothetical protein